MLESIASALALLAAVAAPVGAVVHFWLQNKKLHLEIQELKERQRDKGSQIVKPTAEEIAKHGYAKPMRSENLIAIIIGGCILPWLLLALLATTDSPHYTADQLTEIAWIQSNPEAGEISKLFLYSGELSDLADSLRVLPEFEEGGRYLEAFVAECQQTTASLDELVGELSAFSRNYAERSQRGSPGREREAQVPFFIDYLKDTVEQLQAIAFSAGRVNRSLRSLGRSALELPIGSRSRDWWERRTWLVESVQAIVEDT